MAGAKATVWVVIYVRDSGQSLIHAGSTRTSTFNWIRDHFNELFDDASKSNTALIAELPLDADWSGEFELNVHFSQHANRWVAIEMNGSPADEDESFRN